MPDIAFQLSVAERSGLSVPRAELMLLNRACRWPELGNLFVRKAVTRKARARAKAVPGEVAAMREMLVGPRPEVAHGVHCGTPRVCPFLERCAPELPEHHVSTLYGIRRKAVEKLVAGGCVTLRDPLPEGFSQSEIVARQIRSVQTGAVVVEEGLASVVAGIATPIAFLDFETIGPAIPVWEGARLIRRCRFSSAATCWGAAGGSSIGRGWRRVRGIRGRRSRGRW